MIYLIDYGMGNLFSVAKALKAVGGNVRIGNLPQEINEASALVLPGVGNFGKGISNLREYGLEEIIKDYIDSGRPFLGICLGMQLLMESSEEAPGQRGLSIFSGTVIRFRSQSLKIPQIGWNEVNFISQNPLCKELNKSDYFYFVHSYFVHPDDNSIVAGESEYGEKFTSMLAFKNIFATQFHPEKSQNAGLQILKNFVQLSQKK